MHSANLLGALVCGGLDLSRLVDHRIYLGVQTEVLERKLPWVKYKEQKDNYGQVRF